MQTSIAVPRYSLCLQDYLGLVCIAHLLLRSMPSVSIVKSLTFAFHLRMYSWQRLMLEERAFQDIKQLRDWRASGPQRVPMCMADTCNVNVMQGLTAAEAAKRLDDIGPNEIPFRVHGFFELVFNELFKFFYCYQLVMYVLWFW